MELKENICLMESISFQNLCQGRGCTKRLGTEIDFSVLMF